MEFGHSPRGGWLRGSVRLGTSTTRKLTGTVPWQRRVSAPGGDRSGLHGARRRQALGVEREAAADGLSRAT